MKGKRTHTNSRTTSSAGREERLPRLALVSLLAAAFVFTSCSKDEKEKEPVAAVQMALAGSSNIQRTVVADAILFPLAQSAIVAKVSAPVMKFYVNRGSRVHKGQLLAELENRDLSAAKMDTLGGYEQAQAAYQTTTAASLPEEIRKAELDAAASKQALEAEQKVYESRQKLYQEGALPRKELDQGNLSYIQARNQSEIAQQHLDALMSIGKAQNLKAAQGQLSSAKGKYLGAEAQLSYSEIRSPIDGIVADRPLYPGEMAPAGSPLITVMDVSRVIARAHIAQDEAALLEPGNAATLSVPGNGDDIPGKVMVVSPALDPNSTTVEVWIEAANKEHRLKPGTAVRVAIVSETVTNAVVVPAEALLTSDDGKTSVMVVGDDVRAHQHEVETGIRQGGVVQITKGLSHGQKIVTAGAYGLPDNSKVKIAEEAPQKDSGKDGADGKD